MSSTRQDGSGDRGGRDAIRGSGGVDQSQGDWCVFDARDLFRDRRRIEFSHGGSRLLLCRLRPPGPPIRTRAVLRSNHEGRFEMPALDLGRGSPRPCAVVPGAQDHEALREDKTETGREDRDPCSSEKAPSGDLPHAEEQRAVSDRRLALRTLGYNMRP